MSFSNLCLCPFCICVTRAALNRATTTTQDCEFLQGHKGKSPPNPLLPHMTEFKKHKKNWGLLLEQEVFFMFSYRVGCYHLNTIGESNMRGVTVCVWAVQTSESTEATMSQSQKYSLLERDESWSSWRYFKIILVIKLYFNFRKLDKEQRDKKKKNWW